MGCVALEQKSDVQAELRRMSVHTHWQRHGIGSMLGQELLTYARDVGFQEVFLTTSTVQEPARRMYARLGWVEVSKSRYQSIDFHKLSYKFS